MIKSTKFCNQGRGVFRVRFPYGLLKTIEERRLVSLAFFNGNQKGNHELFI